MVKLRYVVCAVLGVVTALAGISPANAAIDTSAPVLATFAFTPGSVDVTAGTDPVVVTARITDATAAVAPTVTVRSDTTTQSFPGQLARVSGSAQDGTYEATVDIPASAAPGAWTVSIGTLADTVGNADSSAHNNPTKLTVVSNATDVTPPALASFTFTPTTLNVTTGPKQTTVSARITDATGVVAPTVTIRSDTSTQSITGQLSRVSGTAQDGTYEATVDIPTTAAPGAWTVALGSLRDTVGNDDGTVRNNATKLTVVGLSTDVAAPVLASFSFTPTTVDASVDVGQPGGASVTVTARVTDASGAVPPAAVLSSDTTAQSVRGNLALISGTPQDGTYRGTLNLPTTAAPGAWTVAIDELRDPLGNTDRTVHKHTTKLTVVNDDTAKAPSAPTGVTAVRGDQSAQVSWAAAAANRSPVTGYTITASPGGATLTVGGSATTGTVTGLINGISYTFTVKATNAIGTSPPSTPTAAVTPAGVPTAPTNVVAVRGDRSAQVSWSVPVVNGSPITAYTVTASPGNATLTVPGTSTTGTVTGLSNNTAYTFTVKATNAVGTSPASSPSDPVTPSSVPAAPTNVTATRGDKSAEVRWTPPTGSAITGYTVTASPGGATKSVNSATTSTTITGLTNGTAYTFTVTATNATGTSPASTPSAPVTPAAAPAAPTNVTATRGDRSAVVTWTAPVESGSPITGYTITASPGDATLSVGGSSLTGSITGLTNGTAYTFTVRATNALGTSPLSAPSAPVTPAVAPAAPTGVTATRGDGTAQVTWTAPIESGSPITVYAVTTSPGGGTTLVSGASTSATVGGLSNNVSYTFTVTATNAIGTSPASAPSNVLGPASAPTAPTGVTATRGAASAQVSWSAANPNGAPLSQYVVTADPGGLTMTVGGSSTSIVFTGLTNGTTYTFTVRAANAIGTSPMSGPSNEVTPAGKPGRVLSPSGKAKKHTITIRWRAPADTGAPITRYKITSTAGPTRTVGGNTLKTTFKRLKPGVYTFRITAQNEIGAGPRSRTIRVRIHK
jgi:hypothetical protein